MNLSKQEQQMIEAMRIANKAEQKKSNNTNLSEGNFRSSLNQFIIAANLSSNVKVRENAIAVKELLESKGGISKADISIKQYQMLLNMASEATSLDSNLRKEFTLVAQTGTAFNNNKSDEEIAKETKAEFASQRNSINPNEVKLFTNPMTGKVYSADSSGALVEYNPENDYLNAQQESEAAFMEHLQGGGSAETFGVMHDSSLTEV